MIKEHELDEIIRKIYGLRMDILGMVRHQKTKEYYNLDKSSQAQYDAILRQLRLDLDKLDKFIQ